jgi:MSHA biogenesis protein MshI
MLAVHERFVQLVITRQGVMYLTRRIDTARRFPGLNAGSGAQEIDAATLALELQRSLDYYESQYDQTPIGDLVIAPANDRARHLAEALPSETSLRVQLLDVHEYFNVYRSGEVVGDWSALMALGAALRNERAES